MYTQINKKTKNNYMQKNEAVLARKLLEGADISVLDCIRIVKNTLDFKPKNTKLSDMQFCAKILNLGIEHSNIKEMSVEEGFNLYIKTKLELRPASIKDIKYLGRRLFKTCPEYTKMNISQIKLSDLELWLSKTFETAQQYNKAIRMLSTFFNYALSQEWTQRNPIKLIKKRKVIENEIKALSIKEIKALIKTAKRPEFKDCQVGLALLIWAGVRPQELRRISWKDINLKENIISIRSNTSKTGGCRHIEICKALNLYLNNLIKKNPTLVKSSILPQNWINKWKALRKKAGFETWINDVLRHTYASYYIKHYRDLKQLQLNMGHYNLDLLRSRYLNLQDISKDDAKIYFS